MRCSTIEEKFDRYLDDDLRTTERLCVDVHLARCYTCRETLRDYRELNEDVAHLIQHPDPRDHFDALRSRIHAHDASLRTGRRSPRETENVNPRYLVAAGMLVVFGLSAFWGDASTTFQPDPTPELVEVKVMESEQPVIDPLSRYPFVAGEETKPSTQPPLDRGETASSSPGGRNAAL